jgi:hypothetical protein
MKPSVEEDSKGNRRGLFQALPRYLSGENHEKPLVKIVDVAAVAKKRIA